MHLLASLGVAAVIGLAVAVGARGPAPRPFEADPAEFSAGRALRDVQAITVTGLSHHVERPVDHDRVRDALLDRLRELGLDPEVQRTRACRRGNCATVQNIVARVAGREGPPALMLAAHYDSVREGPGAADDGAGVATILEVVRAVRVDGVPRRPIIVLLDDGEELGLLGARAFVAEHRWAREVGVVLNFEARGTAGQTAMFETSARSAWLVEEYARAVARPAASSVIYTLYKALPNDTDLTVFKAAGMEGLNFAFADEVWNYHTPNDDWRHLDLRSVQHMGDQGLAVTRALAARPDVPPPDSDAVWFDIFSHALVRYRARWAWALAILQATVAALAIARCTQRGSATSRALLRGVGRWLATIAGALAAGALASVAIGLLSGRDRPAFSAPLPSWAALVAAAVAGATMADVLIARTRPDFVGPWAGGLIAWSLASVTVSFLLPGASYLFTIPALASSVALLAFLAFSAAPSAAARLTARAGGWLLVAATVPLFLTWLPLVRVLLVIVGAEFHPATTLPIALVVSFLLPLTTGMRGRARWVLPASATAATVVLIGAAVWGEWGASGASGVSG